MFQAKWMIKPAAKCNKHDLQFAIQLDKTTLKLYQHLGCSKDKLAAKKMYKQEHTVDCKPHQS